MTDGPHALVPHVKVVLDRERFMVEDYGALSLFEQHTGVNVLDGEAMMRLNFTQTVVYTWACLHSDDPELELATVQEWYSQPRYQVPMRKAHLELMTEGARMGAEAAGDGAGDGEGGGPLGSSAGSSSSPGPASTSG